MRRSHLRRNNRFWDAGRFRRAPDRLPLAPLRRGREESWEQLAKASPAGGIASSLRSHNAVYPHTPQVYVEVDMPPPIADSIHAENAADF